MYMLPSPEGVSWSWPEVSVMMMVVELSATALADELAEEDVAELDTELDLPEVALAVMEEE